MPEWQTLYERFDPEEPAREAWRAEREQSPARASAKSNDAELEAVIRDARRDWLVWSDLTGRRILERLRHALEVGRRRTRVILDHPAVVSRDFWPVHDRLVSVEAAIQRLVVAGVRSPGRMAALAGLEPEAVELLAELVEGAGPRAGDAGGSREIEQALMAEDDAGALLGARWLSREAESRRERADAGRADGGESVSLRRSSPVWRAAVRQPRRPWTGAAGTASPTPEDLGRARETVSSAIAEAEAEFQASGEDLFAPLPT